MNPSGSIMFPESATGSPSGSGGQKGKGKDLRHLVDKSERLYVIYKGRGFVGIMKGW